MLRRRWAWKAEVLKRFTRVEGLLSGVPDVPRLAGYGPRAVGVGEGGGLVAGMLTRALKARFMSYRDVNVEERALLRRVVCMGRWGG